MLTRLTAFVVAIGILAVLTGPIGSPPGPTASSRPLLYGPSWLPDGLVERQRTETDRTWAPVSDDPGKPKRSLTVSTWAWRDTVDPGQAGVDAMVAPHKCWGFEQGTAVKVGGRPGMYAERTNRGTPGICWRADARTLVSIYHDGLGLSRADLLRIAGSVRPDPGRTRSPLVTPHDVAERLGLGTASGFDVVGGTSPTTWTAKNSWQPDAKGHPQEFEITAGSDVPAPDGGQQLVVNGHPARYIHEVSSGSDTSYLVLDLSRNYRLLIRSYTSSMYGNRPANLQDLVSIAERCHLDTRPLPWIGARGLAP